MNGIAPEPHLSAIARSMVVDANDAKAELEFPRRMRPYSLQQPLACVPRKVSLWAWGGSPPGKNFRLRVASLQIFGALFDA